MFDSLNQTELTIPSFANDSAGQQNTIAIMQIYVLEMLKRANLLVNFNYILVLSFNICILFIATHFYSICFVFKERRQI